MKLFSRALLAALVLLLGACEDPLDRMQGEPGEDGNFYTGELDNRGASGQQEASTEGYTAPAEEGGEGAASGEEHTEEGGEH